jgi:hypothetical protein
MAGYRLSWEARKWVEDGISASLAGPVAEEMTGGVCATEGAFPMRFYLTARHSRGSELRSRASVLILHGQSVTTGWLDEKPDMYSTVFNVVGKFEENADTAEQRIMEINDCELFIVFTEAPDGPHGEDGPEGEIDYAISQGKRVFIVGPLPDALVSNETVTGFPDWQTCLRHLKEHELKAAK